MICMVDSLAPIAVKILLCRCSAQEIATNSGKKLLNKFPNTHHNPDVKSFMKIVESYGILGTF